MNPAVAFCLRPGQFPPSQVPENIKSICSEPSRTISVPSTVHPGSEACAGRGAHRRGGLSGGAQLIGLESSAQLSPCRLTVTDGRFSAQELRQ